MLTPRKLLLLASAALLTCATATQGSVVGLWRMETDTNAGGGYSVPNEVAGGNPLTGAAGSIDSAVPLNPIPQTGLANAGSLNGTADINGSVAWYGALDASSITLEYWARTNEGDARMILRRSGTTGLKIDNPGNVQVQYSTASGQVSFNTGLDHDADWDHFAFTYDQNTGVGQAFVNGTQVAINDGPDGEALTWPAATALLVGNGMDGGPPFSTNSDGFFDELRISNTALGPAQFLNASPLLAKDSFFTTEDGAGGTYDDGTRLYLDADNGVVVQGTVGFSAAKAWSGGDTSNFTMDNDAAGGGGLNHSLLLDEIGGAVEVKAKDPRMVMRELDVSVLESTTYWMSALAYAEKHETGEDMSIGFSGSANNRDQGFSVGFEENGGSNNLVAFAGGSSYTLVEDFALNTSYLLVLKMDVDPLGNETLAGYYAADGGSLIEAFSGLSLEAFTSTADVSYLQIIVNGNGVSDDREWWFDEPRLATTLAGLGVLVPEPASLAVWGLLAILGLARTRRRRR